MNSKSFRLFTIIAALCLAMGLFVMPAFAAEAADTGGITEELLHEGETAIDDAEDGFDFMGETADEYVGAEAITDDFAGMGDDFTEDFDTDTEAFEDGFADTNDTATDEEGIDWLFIRGAAAILIVAGIVSFIIAGKKAHTPLDQQGPPTQQY